MHIYSMTLAPIYQAKWDLLEKQPLKLNDCG